MKLIKKLIWFIDAYINYKKHPLNESLFYIGVTGTDGKTTTSTVLYQMALETGYTPLLLTTNGAKFNGDDIKIQLNSSTFFSYSIKNLLINLKKLNLKQALRSIFFLDKSGFEEQRETHRTTPLAVEIRKTILEYEAKGANFFILETTSHALDQYRVWGIKFDSIVFTNITNEHLDYHGNWLNYARTKAKLIKMLKDGGAVSINKDDKKSYDFLKNYINKLNSSIKVFEYSIKDLKNINEDSFFIKINENNSFFALPNTPSTNLDESIYIAKLKMLGKFNIYNALASISCFYSFNPENMQNLVNSFKNVKSIKGRMNIINKNPDFIVDFAHTANGVKNVLKNTKKKKNGKIWVLFGCAGLRDKYKRSAIGKYVYKYCDNILITGDDPRTESLLSINNEIISGFKYIDEHFTIHSYYDGLIYDPSDKFIVRFDEPNINCRINAIKFAVKNAEKNDLVLFLGKGHESTINFNGIEYEWDEISIIQSIMKEYADNN